MDLLYSKYSNPFEFMNIYINQGRFGEFVSSIIEIENKKRTEASEKDNEDKLFNVYVHSRSEKSFVEWKKEAFEQSTKKESLSMTNAEVVNEKEKARSILKRFSMK